MWAQTAASRASSLRLLRKGVSVLFHRHLAHGFLAWHRVAEIGRGHCGSVISVARGRLDTMKASRFWAVWLFARCERRRQLGSQQGALSHLLHGRLLHGWNRWHETSTKQTAAKPLIRWGVQALRHRCLTHGMTELALVWRDGQRARGLLSRGCLYMLHQERSRAWSAWLVAAAMRELSLGSWLHWRRRQLREAWACWSDATRKTVGHHAAGRRSAWHLLNSRLACAWSTWLERAALRLNRMQLLRRAAVCLTFRQQVLGFSRWRRACERGSSHAVERARAEGMRVRGLLARALATWRLRRLPTAVAMLALGGGLGVATCWQRWRHQWLFDVARRLSDRSRTLRLFGSAVRVWQLVAWSQVRSTLDQEKRTTRSALQVLGVTESYRAAAEKAVQLLTERLNRAEVSNAEQADTLTLAMTEANSWLQAAREGWLTARHDLERRHATELMHARAMTEPSPTLVGDESPWPLQDWPHPHTPDGQTIAPRGRMPSDTSRRYITEQHEAHQQQVELSLKPRVG